MLQKPKLIVLSSFMVCYLSGPPLSEGQSPLPMTFEVASVRPTSNEPPRDRMSTSGEITGGPGTADPTRLVYSWTPMLTISHSAFGLVYPKQLEGFDSARQERFDIVAKVPPGVSKKQVQEMMQSLLKDRFHLVYHRVPKEIPAYTLQIAKGGPKMKAAAPADGPKPSLPVPYTLDGNGFPQLPAGYTLSQGTVSQGVVRMAFRMMSPAQLVARLTRGVIPMMDETGLTGPYDFTLEYSGQSLIQLLGATSRSSAPVGDATDPAPDIFAALEKQLGLKLVKSTTTIQIFVIDHLDKMPTEN